MDDLRPVADALLRFLDGWGSSSGVDAAHFDLIGFSQGAALAYVLALDHPERVRRLAGLAGFVPDGAEDLLPARPLASKPVFIAHGRHDRLVPIDRARASVTDLEKAGAQVTYCEAEVGHKVSAECFRGLEAFFVPVL